MSVKYNPFAVRARFNADQVGVHRNDRKERRLPREMLPREFWIQTLPEIVGGEAFVFHSQLVDQLPEVFQGWKLKATERLMTVAGSQVPLERNAVASLQIETAQGLGNGNSDDIFKRRKIGWHNRRTDGQSGRDLAPLESCYSLLENREITH